MNVTIINDCSDANARGRQEARVASFFNGNVSFVGVQSDLNGIGNIEAAGCLIDVLDGYGDAEGVVLVNVAPRSGDGKQWENGTPFGYFQYKNVLVVSTVSGVTLSLVKKLGLVDSVTVLDVPTVMKKFAEEGVVDVATADRVIKTQFRSFEFSPRVAAYLSQGGKLEGQEHAIDTFPDIEPMVWWVDSFGNCKTTLLASDINTAQQTQTTVGNLPYYSRLKEVPNDESALITGSSGTGEQRFIELIVQGKPSAKVFNLSVGSSVLN